MNLYAERLAASGMSIGEAASKGQLFERALKSLPEPAPGCGPLHVFYVPGRIEVLGKHTDYGGGRSLLSTVERGFCLIARPRPDHEVRVINARSRTLCSLALNPELQPVERQWCNYPATVVRRLARNFPAARRGADISFVSDLPAASGMSSSSAFMVSIFLALASVNQLSELEAYRREIHNLEDLAGYLGTIENGQSFGSLSGDSGVGTFGGSEDHAAILCSHAGELRQYSFCPIRHERTIAFPDNLVFTIGVSGIIAIKTGGARVKYNQASLAARKILEVWRAASGRSDLTLAAAIDREPDAAEQIREVLRQSKDENFSSQALSNRFEQFLAESTAILPAAADALAAGNLSQFGSWVARSQQGAEDLLGNQVPETIALARSARSLGAVAASAFGAGFGGSVWALVRAADAAEFQHRWEAEYRERFPAVDHARFFSTRPGPAAQSIVV